MEVAARHWFVTCLHQKEKVSQDPCSKGCSSSSSRGLFYGLACENIIATEKPGRWLTSSESGIQTPGMKDDGTLSPNMNYWSWILSFLIQDSDQNEYITVKAYPLGGILECQQCRSWEWVAGFGFCRYKGLHFLSYSAWLTRSGEADSYFGGHLGFGTVVFRLVTTLSWLYGISAIRRPWRTEINQVGHGQVHLAVFCFLYREVSFFRKKSVVVEELIPIVLAS